MRFRGENPIYKRVDYSADWTDQATYTGVAGKTMLLLVIAAISAYSVAISLASSLSFGTMIGALIVSPILAFIFVIMAHRNTQMAFIYSILYALFEGAFLGVISMVVAAYAKDSGFDNAVLYAMAGTFGSLFVMLILYSTRLIRVGEGFMSFMRTALVTIVFMSLIGLVLFLFTGSAYFISPIYITIVVFSLIFSVLFLLYDFRRVESYVSSGTDKANEWSLSLGLVTTIVWIYIEILRLILILSRKR